MGVSGCGKTTIASRLAETIGGIFLEGDDFHPPENKKKMAQAIPLTDGDRIPWLNRLVEEVRSVLETGKSPVLACSALKQSYRDQLTSDFPNWRLVYLEGSFDLIKSRMDARQHEYMSSALLRSQFDTLETPWKNQHTLTLSIESPVEEILDKIATWL